MGIAHDSDETTLVDGCRRGDREAQRVLFERHHRAIYRFLLAHCGDPALAEDLTQDTFLRVFQSVGRFKGRSSIGSWMMRIALNCLYAAGRRSEIGRRARARSEAGEPRLEWTQPRHRAPRHGLRDRLRRALGVLSDADRSVVLLHDLLGHRYREIAEILQIPPGTVASRLSRARDRLRVELARLESTAAVAVEQTGPSAHPTDEDGSTSDPEQLDSDSRMEIPAPVLSKP